MTVIPRSIPPLSQFLLPMGQLVRTTGAARAVTLTMALTVLPQGGQRAARQNAWASMSEGSARACGRREADTAMDRAVSMSRHRAARAR